VAIDGQPLSNVTSVAASWMYSLALNREGRVVAWGKGPGSQLDNGLTVPAGLSNVTAIAAGYGHALALKSDGTVVGWGRTILPPGLREVVAIAAGQGEWAHDWALKRDGTVVEWAGRRIENEVPLPSALSNAVAISVGVGHYLALRADRTVFGWGLNGCGQATGTPTKTVPSDKYGTNGVVAIDGQVLSNVVAVAAGSDYSLALRQDGTVVGWGRWHGLYPVPVPTGLTNVVAIAGGHGFCLAITTNAAAFSDRQK
jgi:trimeric autotransporter adhesin